MKYFEATKWTLLSFVTFELKHIRFTIGIKLEILDVLNTISRALWLNISILRLKRLKMIFYLL